MKIELSEKENDYIISALVYYGNSIDLELEEAEILQGLYNKLAEGIK